MADCPRGREVDPAAVVGAVELALLEQQGARCDEGERRIGRRRGVAHRERKRADDVVAEATQREHLARAAAALHLPVAVARRAGRQGARAGIARRVGQGVGGLVEIDGERLARAIGRIHGVAPVAVVAGADREAQLLAPVARCAGRQLELGAARRIGVLEARQPLRAGGIDLDALGHAAAAVAGPGDLAAIARLDRHELARSHLVLARAVGARGAAVDLDGQLGFRLGGRLRHHGERQPAAATSPTTTASRDDRRQCRGAQGLRCCAPHVLISFCWIDSLPRRPRRQTAAKSIRDGILSHHHETWSSPCGNAPPNG